MITRIGIVILIVAFFIYAANDFEKNTTGMVFLIIGIIFTLLGCIMGFLPIAIGDYSQGERVGVISKISNKGMVCKTNEGYILLGSVSSKGVAERFDFTVKNGEVLKKINEKVGQSATLVYQEYLYSTPCWGASSYEIIDVK